MSNYNLEKKPTDIIKGVNAVLIQSAVESFEKKN